MRYCGVQMSWVKGYHSSGKGALIPLDMERLMERLHYFTSYTVKYIASKQSLNYCLVKAFPHDVNFN